MSETNNIKVSVIMPSLNVAPYIDECIRSVMHQTLQEIEIICVDAGSTDGTLDILHKYEKDDSRIHVINSEMKSYGYQVNMGFSQAKGEYLAIVETDDFIKSDMYERLYVLAKENDLDYIKGNFARFKGSSINREFFPAKIVENDCYYNRVLWAGDEWSVFNGSIYPWAGIYKRSLIIENKIRLNETKGASYQDNGLAFQVYAYGKRGYFIDEEFYYLRREEQDASFYAPNKVNEIFVEFDFIYDFLVKSGFYDVFAPRFWKLKYQTFCWRANMLADEHKLEFMQKFSDDFKNAFQDGLLNLKCFNKSEKDYLFKIIASPDLVCWKKYYTLDSVWQKNAVSKNKVELPENRIPIAGKRILIVSNELSFSGAQLSALAQSKVLREAGAYVEVWSLKEGELHSVYEQEGFKIKIVMPQDFCETQIQDNIKQFDLAIINTILSIAAADVCMKLIPTIFYIRSDGELITHFLQKAIAFQSNYEKYYAFKNAEYIVAVSETCGEWVRENINPNAYVINNFLEDKFNDYDNKIRTVKNGDVIKFLALGTIEPRKGYDIYIEAFQNLPNAYRKKCEIHFAGRQLKGCEKFYKNIVGLAEKTPNCFYHGEILDRDELYKLILDCDVVVVPSRSESFSRVAIEGAMLSKPVILTEDVGAKFLINKDTGWIVKTANAKSLSDAFRDAINNADKLNDMGANAREMYLKTCSKEIYSKNLVDYAERVLYDSNKNKSKRFADFYSFDVFDTLFTRKTATPTGIFTLVQEKLQTQKEWAGIPEHVKNNFYDLRVNAERLARFMNGGTPFDKLNPNYSAKEDITFEAIYNVFTFSNLLTKEQAARVMELEIQTEIENVVAIPRNVSLVKELLQNGKRVVALSDMYHSSATIKRMLVAADPIFESLPVYVSSELALTKGGGNAFRKVREIEKLKFENWKHTGDNKRGDFEVPKQLGINACLYPISWLTEFERYILGDLYRNPDMQKFVSIAQNTRVLNNFTGKSALGADLGLFFLIPYIDFILDTYQKQNIKRLYFIARDGYILKQIADVLINKRALDIATKYVYGSRKALRVFSDNPEEIDITTLISYSNHNYIGNVEKLAEVFSLTTDELLQCLPKEYTEESSFNEKELYALAELLNNNDDFKKLLSKNDEDKRNLMISYFEQEIDFSDSNYAFVELDGSGLTTAYMSRILFNCQKSNSPVKTFFYWATNTNLTHKSYNFISFMPSKISRGNILECLCRAPHAQVIEYSNENGKIIPIFADNKEGEILMAEGYGEYIAGVLSATELYAENPIKPANMIGLVERAFNYITNKPDAEMLTFLGDIPFEASGRSDKIMRFAPALTKEDIFNVYFLRHINKEPVEKYFPVSYFDYCLLRCTPWDKGLIAHYTRLVADYTRKRMLSKLTEADLAAIRNKAESMDFKGAPRISSGNADEELRNVYASYSWRLGHKQVLFAKKIKNSWLVKKLLSIGIIKKAAKKIVHIFLK